jgi:uncharacterized protein YktB (UPF0637 family)
MSATSATSPCFRKTTHPAEISRLVIATGYYNDRLEMPMDLFSRDDFKVFEIPGFAERMAAIRANIQPRLVSIGEALVPHLSSILDVPLFLHVAKHMRRTVNPPDDTWAAFGRDRRGYKKDVHFRVSVSGKGVRFLFEAGREYYEKSEWVRGWNRSFASLVPDLQNGSDLGWFKDEHEDLPVKALKAMSSPELRGLARELTRRKDGQFVLGRNIAAPDFLKLTSRQFEKLSIASFAAMAPLFEVHKPWVLVPRS